MSELTVLILGGTGIIGRELSAVALAAGHHVSIVSRGGLRGTQDATEEIVGDARDTPAFAAVLGDRHFDVVVDLLSFDAEQLSKSLALFLGRCAQYVFVSSATIFEGAAPGKTLTEDSPRIDGPWRYPALKIGAEDLMRAECVRTGQAFTIVRPYITYSEQRVAFGAWEVRDILGQLLGDRPVIIGKRLSGTVTSLTHSRDLARGIVGLLGNPRAMNEDFNIASEEQVTWAEVQQIAAEIVGKPLTLVTIPDEEVLRVFPHLAGKIADRLLPRAFDTSKLKGAVPTFTFEYSVREGYADVIPQLLARGLKDPTPSSQGRMDRLLARAPGYGRQSRRYAFELARRSPIGLLRYAIERYSLLVTAKRITKYLVRKLANTDSGLKSGKATAH